ncbi:MULTISPECIES: thioredoxin family protein [Amniculibacterium]|uniref:thioredoxin family protein n=1 Tax=Amniculibacterium TaxID=2715289 RepID=UPI000F59169F|nr:MULTISPECIES: thioredoxin family protein [Amniculibacterium]
MKNYWDKTVNFQEYFNIADERVKNPIEGDEKQEYYNLGVQRMNRTLKTFKVEDDLSEAFKAKNFNGKIMIISEPWCGDASATVPALYNFFEACGTDCKIFLRDQDTSLIDQFLTDGTQSIPKVLILNEDFSVKASWGPRPKFGLELLKKFKENPESYPREEFYNDLQVYYAKNRGRDAIQEILELI